MVLMQWRRHNHVSMQHVHNRYQSYTYTLVVTT